MIICDSKKLVFVHVQKTGGVTMNTLLKAQLDDDDVRQVAKRHAPLDVILAKEPELTDYWIFGFVRNPWDRMVSWWSMIENWRRWNERKGQDIDQRGNHFWRVSSGYQDFDEFVMRGTEDFKRLRRNQIDFLVAGDRRADFIGRTENLSEDANHALEQVGLTTETIGHHNKGKRSDYQSYYTPATRDRIAQVFAKDIDEFGYEF
ncbi:MAG: sulfotransferase family protein [Actinomycetota bacterium]|nr:sulfotransferase family protein [Actinomycetota bacterium]